MSFVDSLAEWFTDSSRALPKKLGLALTILIGILTVNDLLGFAYFYRMDKKIESFGKLTKIISDPGTDSASRAKALILREEIICRQPNYLVFLNILGRFCRSISAVKKTTVATTETTTKIAANASIRNEILFLVSSSGIYMILGIVLIPFTFLHKGQTAIQKIAGSIIMLLSMSFITIAMYYLTNLIPVLFNNWAFNYIINTLIQIGSIALWIILARKV